MHEDDHVSALLSRARIDIALSREAEARLLESVRRTASRRRRRIGMISGALALTIGAGFAAMPAAADVVRQFLAQTGVTCEGTECGGVDVDDAELIDLRASDLGEYVASQYPDYLVLPAGMSRQSVIDELLSEIDVPMDEASFMADSAIVGGYEAIAYCGWVAEWLRAEESGEPTRRGVAADALTQILDWPGPMQSSPDANLLALQEAFAEAARTGDTDGVQTAALFNHCDVGDGIYRADWVNAHVVDK